MLVTRETDYAVRCVLYLAQDKDQVASVGEIADQMHIPKSFLAKILQRLVREGIVESIRGVNGGFRLLRSPAQITLLEVLTAIQGVAPVNSCAIDKRRCNLSSRCGVHPVWIEIRREIERRLATQTIQSLTSGK
jgi:Rrf2 family protein